MRRKSRAKVGGVLTGRGLKVVKIGAPLLRANPTTLPPAKLAVVPTFNTPANRPADSNSRRGAGSAGRSSGSHAGIATASTAQTLPVAETFPIS